MQRHEDYIRRVGNRLVEYGVEPTREDFAEWLKGSDKVTTEGRRGEIEALYDLGTPLWEMVGKLTETEELSWWQYVNYLIDEQTDW